MNVVNAQCPPASALSDFGLGKLDAASADAVSQHLELCSECRSRVASLSSDGFVDLLREAGASADADSRSVASTTQEHARGDNGGHEAPSAARTASAEDAAELPAAFGRYQVQTVLGQGGFGVVYLGLDPELRRTVAIKVPRRDRLSSSADTEAYLAEARLLAAVAHPGIVPVYDVGRTEDGLCYVVSQHMPRGDLGALLGQRRLTVDEAVEITMHVAEALHHAHRQGLVHRDIKPSNLLLDQDGHPQVADFGLALTDDSYGRGASVSGTPAYMSPEQARRESHLVDARSDIYSLGVVLYEMLTGRRPHRCSDPRELLEEIANRQIRPPRQLDHTIPQELETICLKALAKSPADRYTTAFDLANDLRRWESSTQAPGGQSADAPVAEFAGVRGAPPFNRKALPWRSFRLLVGCGGLLTIEITAAALLVGGVLLFGTWKKPTEIAHHKPSERGPVAIEAPESMVAPAMEALPPPPRAAKQPQEVDNPPPPGATVPTPPSPVTLAPLDEPENEEPPETKSTQPDGNGKPPGSAMQKGVNPKGRKVAPAPGSTWYLCELPLQAYFVFVPEKTVIPGIVPGFKFPSGAALSLKGDPTPHGLYTPPPANGFSFLNFKLAGKAKSISFEVGLDKGSPRVIATKPVFQVWGDNKLLWASSAITGTAHTEKCENLDVEGIRILVLRVNCPGRKEGVEPVWYEPTITWK